MSLIPVTLIPPSFAPDYCISDIQAFANALIGGTQASVTVNFTTILLQEAEPGVGDRDKVWFRIFGDGSPDRWYIYWNGDWVHPYRGGFTTQSGERMLWEGTLADLWSFDGGDGVDPGATPPTETTGPFWEEATAFQGRSPIGVGAIPGSDPAKSIALSEDYGDGSHPQTIAEMPPHTHSATYSQLLSGNNNPTYQLPVYDDDIADPPASTKDVPTGSAGSGTAMNMVHPVHGVYFAKRTARKYWTPI